MKVNQAIHAVGLMCRLLEVSRSGFYAWVDRPMCTRRRRDLELTGKICAIHRRSRETYGAPNIHAELADDHGIRVGGKRVARLMRGNGIRGATLRKYVVTTQSDPEAAKPIDLVERRFFADAPDRLWVADMTYIPTWSGWLYLAMVLDVYSRKVVGWAMDTNMRTELIFGCAADGGDPASAARRHPSLGPRIAIHELRLRQALQGSRHRAVDGFGERCLRQRNDRELLRDARA